MNQEGIDAAAQLGALGLDPLRFLQSTDSFERSLMLELAKRMAEYKNMLDKGLAIEIVNALAKAMKS